MNEEKINNSPKKLRILVAPLDWGLGHATRCIAIIRLLLKHNTEVLLAAKGDIRTLLEKEFPELTFLPLAGYGISYTRHRKLFLLNLITQLPKILLAIGNEKKWLQKMVNQEGIDAVISDNRPGLHHPNVPCIYITHQLQIQTGSNISDIWIRKWHYSFINKFQQCWIPDNESKGIIAGALSHPASFPATPCKYIGILSRFEKKELENKYNFLLLLSGPEPQRSLLETKLVKAFDASAHSFALVRGLPDGGADIELNNEKGKVYNHLPAEALNDLILQSEIVVARAGFSTIMDLVKLQKQAVLIPTPGQTEQEYLANYLGEKNLFASVKQENISLANIRMALSKFSLDMQEKETLMQENVITDWLSSLPQPAPAI